ncbi:MAG: T9SS type A sorting domain-containing protein [Lewinellaceae bacterium]|nr:T9SS type A sorting domain-containing protein [Lewinellaceae bacterium]
MGSGSATSVTNTPAFDLKIYPNPYFGKATLDVNIEKSAPVAIEMTDESGALVAVLLPYRVLPQGFYRFELPNVASGVYFVKCQAGKQTTVRKVVKAAAQ